MSWFQKRVVFSIPTALAISSISQRLFLDLTPIRRLTPIELIHRVQFNPGRTVFNCTALLVANHVPVDSHRDSWVPVPQLLLRHSWGCTVCEQSTCRTVTHEVEPAQRNAQLLKQRVQNLCPQFVGLVRTATPIDEEQVSFHRESVDACAVVPLNPILN